MNEPWEKSNSFVDYYKILNVKRDSTLDQIKTSFRKLAKMYHPDSNQEDNEGKFKTINFAYGILKDSKKREKYNEYYDKNINTQKNNKPHAYKTKTQKNNTKKYKKWVVNEAKRRKIPELILIQKQKIHLIDKPIEELTINGYLDIYDEKEYVNNYNIIIGYINQLIKNFKLLDNECKLLGMDIYSDEINNIIEDLNEKKDKIPKTINECKKIISTQLIIEQTYEIDRFCLDLLRLFQHQKNFSDSSYYYEIKNKSLNDYQKIIDILNDYMSMVNKYCLPSEFDKALSLFKINKDNLYPDYNNLTKQNLKSIEIFWELQRSLYNYGRYKYEEKDNEEEAVILNAEIKALEFKLNNLRKVLSPIERQIIEEKANVVRSESLWRYCYAKNCRLRDCDEYSYKRDAEYYRLKVEMFEQQLKINNMSADEYLSRSIRYPQFYNDKEEFIQIMLREVEHRKNLFDRTLNEVEAFLQIEIKIFNLKKELAKLKYINENKNILPSNTISIISDIEGCKEKINLIKKRYLMVEQQYWCGIHFKSDLEEMLELLFLEEKFLLQKMEDELKEVELKDTAKSFVISKR